MHIVTKADPAMRMIAMHCIEERKEPHLLRDQTIAPKGQMAVMETTTVKVSSLMFVFKALPTKAVISAGRISSTDGGVSCSSGAQGAAANQVGQHVGGESVASPDAGAASGTDITGNDLDDLMGKYVDIMHVPSSRRVLPRYRWDVWRDRRES